MRAIVELAFLVLIAGCGQSPATTTETAVASVLPSEPDPTEAPPTTSEPTEPTITPSATPEGGESDVAATVTFGDVEYPVSAEAWDAFGNGCFTGVPGDESALNIQLANPNPVELGPASLALLGMGVTVPDWTDSPSGELSDGFSVVVDMSDDRDYFLSSDGDTGGSGTLRWDGTQFHASGTTAWGGTFELEIVCPSIDQGLPDGGG